MNETYETYIDTISPYISKASIGLYALLTLSNDTKLQIHEYKYIIKTHENYIDTLIS